MPFTLATGKILPATQAQADELRIEQPLIMANGSVLQSRSGEVHFHARMPEEVVRGAIRICEERGEDLVLYIIDKIYIKKMNENIYPTYCNVESGLMEIGNWGNLDEKLDQITKCVVIDAKNQQNLIDVGEIFRNQFGDRAEMVHTSTKLVELHTKGISKGTAVQRLAQELGVRMDEVMAFGDYDNDAPMLSAAGLGIAVENASAAAKAAADLVIGSCAENAPAKFLDELIQAEY